MTTYTALRYQDNLYLVREPVVDKPRFGYEYFGKGTDEQKFKQQEFEEQFTSAILVPKEHEQVFEGRTGMVEGKDFEHVWNCNKANSGCCGYDEEKDTCECMVAIPKEPGAGEEDSEQIIATIRTALTMGKIGNDQQRDTIAEGLFYLLSQSFHITRKKP